MLAGKRPESRSVPCCYLGLDLRLGFRCNSNHCDNSADPDNHAQHGEQCAKQVAPTGPHGNLDGGDKSCSCALIEQLAGLRASGAAQFPR